jgi:hypothetical protein
MIVQITGITPMNVEVLKAVLLEQGYINSVSVPKPKVFQIAHDLSKECRDLCADLLDEGFSIQLVAPLV